MPEEKISFFIMMHEDPARWIGLDDSALMSEEEFEIWEKLDKSKLFPNRKYPHHPCLRFEDIIAHLFMQVVSLPDVERYCEVNGKTLRSRFVVKIIKTARQYANQMMKKICWNCRHAFNISDGGCCTAPGLSEKSSKQFAEDLYTGDCHKNCPMCRVGKDIQFANQFEHLIYGYDDIHHEMLQIAVRWKNKAIQNRKRWKRTRFINRKVIEEKRHLAKCYAASNDDRVRMQKKVDELRGHKPLSEKELTKAYDAIFPNAKDIKDIHEKIAENGLGTQPVVVLDELGHVREEAYEDPILTTKLPLLGGKEDKEEEE